MRNSHLRGRVFVAAALFSAGAAFAQDNPAPPATGQPAISLDDLQDNPEKYSGQLVKVSGEVSTVLGPRAFTIDEGKLIDFDSDVVVVTPAPLAAMVTARTPITIIGTVRPILETDIKQEWGWFDNNPTIKAELQQRPGLVAQSIVNTKDGTELAVRLDTSGEMAPRVGAPGEASSTVTDLTELARSTDQQMVGKRVNVRNAVVEDVTTDGGFWVSVGEDKIFVLPATSPTTARLTPGQTVGLEGVVLALPDQLQERLGSEARDERIYLYANRVEQVI